MKRKSLPFVETRKNARKVELFCKLGLTWFHNWKVCQMKCYSIFWKYKTDKSVQFLCEWKKKYGKLSYIHWEHLLLSVKESQVIKSNNMSNTQDSRDSKLKTQFLSHCF